MSKSVNQIKVFKFWTMHSKQKIKCLIIWYIKCLVFVWQSDSTKWWYIKCLFFVWQSDLTKWWYIKCLFFVWQSDLTKWWYIKCLFFVWQSDSTKWWYIKCLFFVWQSDLTKWWYIQCLFFVWQSDWTRPSDDILNVFLSDSLTKCLTVWAKVTWYIWCAYCLTESNQVMVDDCFPWGMGITKVSDSE